MSFVHRKLLDLTKNIVVVIKDEHHSVPSNPHSDDDYPLIPPPPPSHHSISPLVIFTFCALGVAFVFICYLTLSTRYRRRVNNSRTNLGETRQDFVVDEDQGPVIDHPIWLINTVGLEQSVIDSIHVFKYKRAERLVEGTECSVCLNEFQDDENLRLLPKCNHAFHIPCIDTWLRSHKNCPLCRAPIVRPNAQEGTVDPNSNELGSSSEENVDETSEEMRDGVENDEEDNIGEILQKNSRLFGVSNSRVRVKSDLADYRGKVEEELQPVRRSISMDSSSASMIYSAVANMEQESCTDNQLVQAKKQNSMKSTKRHKGSSSGIYKRVMGSSSFGRSSRKLSISMRRSYSSNGKYSHPSDSKSQDSSTVSED